MSGLSAGNQTDSATDGTDSATDGSSGGGGSDSMGTTTGATSNTSNTTNTSNSTTTGNTTNTTDETTGAGCIDNDGDGYGEGCGLGSDCNDDDFNNYTPDGCANCMDVDADDVWAGCDQYDENKQGPDCDDNNDQVGLGDAVELCNGLAENCAGEVDPLPPDEMCPTNGDPPNVTSWLCEPPAPGEDGCKVGSCSDQFFDVNGVADDGCECQGTDYSKAIDSCGDAMNGKIGTVGEGVTVDNLVVGVIPKLDNGVGSGAEDWYWVEFPDTGRPAGGAITVNFAVNEGSDYRFEVFRACGQDPWANSLATQYGAGAPPALEWTFEDTNTANAMYSNTVLWPTKAYIRVFRVQNDNSCSKYQLKVARTNEP
ncbi:MAG: hypothetical protein H6711_26185 [Myxococcales bacterium]|nr:hypothetical protein [Myxococcales bacterium]